MKLKVLILDDNEQQRMLMIAALVRKDGRAVFSEDLVRNARELYDIKECVIPGAAIQSVVKDGYRPDLAIVDIDYQDLKESMVSEAGFIHKDEATPLRGFDVLEELRRHSPGTISIMFTGKAEELDIVRHELAKRHMRLNSDYLVNAGKETGHLWLSQLVYNAFEGMVQQWVETIQSDEKERLRLRCLENTGEQRFEGTVELRNRFFVLKDLFAYKRILKDGGRLDWDEPDPIAYIQGLFHLETFIPGFKAKGIWKKSWVHQFILDWRQHESYQASEASINNDVSDYIIYLVRKSRYLPCTKANGFEFIGNSNIGKKTRRFGDPQYTDYFINALKTRRILIGLTQLAAERVWGKGGNIPHNTILYFYMNDNNLADTDENLRVYITAVRGLPIRYQGIRQVQECLLEEEKLWLRDNYPVLLQAVKSIQH